MNEKKLVDIEGEYLLMTADQFKLEKKPCCYLEYFKDSKECYR
jgi:hypothetical protein